MTDLKVCFTDDCISNYRYSLDLGLDFGDKMVKRYLQAIFGDKATDLRSTIIGIYSLLIVYNIAVWFWAYAALRDAPVLFSTAVLAYTFGLRHAVDADHIAAIDNVTRKLMQEGKQPVSAGLFFSLGHSTVVMIATIGIALITATLMHSKLTGWYAMSTIIGTSLSALFLFLIATINLMIFISIYQIFQKVRRDKQYNEAEVNILINNRGFLSRYLGGLFRLITHSWQMYPLGFLFGIGFDTATEITLLGITASETLNGISIWSILILPASFTAGMTLIDTTDCIIMLGAYGWAFIKPVRKLYYNLTITSISIIVALVVGGIEVLGLIANKVDAHGEVWGVIKSMNNHLSSLGYIIILIFMASWLISFIIYRFMQLDKIEVK